jgi:hypothetical protein
MTELSPRLSRLGDVLERAVAADLARQPRAPRRLRSRRLLLLAAALAALVGGGAAIAAGVLKTAEEQERGMLGGHLLFEGSDPSCESLSTTSFRCTLERPPTRMTFYRERTPTGSPTYDAQTFEPVSDVFLGMRMVTVDSDLRVDGACVSTRADGRVWDCFLGQEAVERGLVRPELLGRSMPSPPTG